MKSRTSFFNLTVFRKDITRFAPAWGLYLVGMLMLVPSFAGGFGYSMGGIAYFGRTIGVLSVVNILYAFVCAALLFGDLFNARLCNALHAMPMRREGWFLTHLARGMLVSMVPNLVVCIPHLGGGHDGHLPVLLRGGGAGRPVYRKPVCHGSRLRTHQFPVHSDPVDRPVSL